MASITFKGNTINTSGTLPEVGSLAPDFTLTKSDLSDTTLADYKGKKVVLNIFPSVDTGICAASVRAFNAKASEVDNTVVLCISKDLPFAHKRFCEAEGLSGVVPTSQYKNNTFEDAYHVSMVEGPLAGLFSRAVVILNEDGKVVYTEQVPEIAQEPDYEKAIAAIS
ncbi:thiol peroxidase [Chondrinema litorale]|uniref:thiol peroxidase n=1 Tax=Chondrinema litorale TaxID=2994555 RepID=UPI00254430D3|nr:thiol peroxidase [Chondrinema litorale]UZR92492.1 thiol peroxidase [Chondrinema litorale]